MSDIYIDGIKQGTGGGGGGPFVLLAGDTMTGPLAIHDDVPGIAGNLGSLLVSHNEGAASKDVVRFFSKNVLFDANLITAGTQRAASSGFNFLSLRASMAADGTGGTNIFLFTGDGHLKIGGDAVLEALVGTLPLTLRGGGSGATDILKLQTVGGFLVLTVDANGQVVILADPVSALGVATKQYVDAVPRRVTSNLLIDNDATFPNSIIDVKADSITIENLLKTPLDVEINIALLGAGGIDDTPDPSSDNFDRADSNSLDAPWTESENAAITIRILSNKLALRVFDTVEQVFSKGYARYSSSTPNDQKSKLTFKAKTGTSDGSKTGPMVRGSGTSTSFTGYGAVYGGNTNNIQIRKWVAQSLDVLGTQIGSTYTVTLVDGDTVELEVVGTALKVYVNGIERISGTDSAIASGDPGVLINNNFGANPGANFNMDWDNWVGGAGAATASKWFAVWLIAKTDGTVAGMFSESFTAPTMPSGYTKKRRVGAVRKNPVNNFYRCIQLGDFASYYDPTYDISNHRILSAGSASAFTTLTGANRTCPPTSRRALVRVEMAPTAALQRCFVRPTGTGVTGGKAIALGDTSGDSTQVESFVEMDASQQFDYRMTSTGALDMDINGYIDPVL